MRNKRTMIGLVAVLIAALTASLAWAAEGDKIQTIKGTVAPNKLPKKKFKNASINVVTTAGVEDANGGTDEDARPAPATRALLTFDKDIKFNTNTVTPCTANLNQTTTDAAKELCPKSIVGGGAGIVGFGQTNNKFDATITAFNGPKQNGKGTLILHSRIDALGQTALLNGVIGKKGNSPTLDVTIPLIAAGQGSVLRFQTKVAKGKYIQARCPDKKFALKGAFTYNDGTSKTATSKQTCKGTGR